MNQALFLAAFKVLLKSNWKNLSFLKKQDEVLNGPQDIKILTIGESGLDPLIYPIISKYKKLLQNSLLLCYNSALQIGTFLWENYYIA